MLKLIKDAKAQAAVELAIIAGVIIVAFASLINFTEKINRTQERMQTIFRKGQLPLAFSSGQTSAGTLFYVYRAPNIKDPYVPGELVYFKSSGDMLWGSQGNETFSPVTGTEIDKNDKNVEFYTDKQSENINYTKTLTRTENLGSYPVTNRTVTYVDETGKTITRSGP